MVYTPTRGDGPARFGPGVPLIPEIGPGLLDAGVYTDPERYQHERTAVLAPSWQAGATATTARVITDRRARSDKGHRSG